MLMNNIQTKYLIRESSLQAIIAQFQPILDFQQKALYYNASLVILTVGFDLKQRWIQTLPCLIQQLITISQMKGQQEINKYSILKAISKVKKIKNGFINAQSLQKQVKFEGFDILLKQAIKEEQLSINHGKNLCPMTQNNHQIFSFVERSAPSSKNLRKTLYQLKQSARKQIQCLNLSQNYTRQQIIAIFEKNNPSQPDDLIAEAIYCSCIHFSEILYYLSFRTYPYLTTINLTGNSIQSIQLISDIQMPFLRFLYLWNNNIASLKPLKRTVWPNLVRLDLHQNKFAQLKDLRYLTRRKNDKDQLLVVIDCNKIVDFNEAIVLCSNNKLAKINLIDTQILSIMGRPLVRRKRKGFSVEVCLMKVKYV